MHKKFDTIDAFMSGSHHEREPLSVGLDFEDKVFAKIKRKKQVRRNIAAAITGFSLAGFLFLAHSLFIVKGPRLDNNKQIPLIAQQESSPRGKQVMTAHEQTEEIPLMEDVIFATSDSQTDYVLEQVSYVPDDGTI